MSSNNDQPANLDRPQTYYCHICSRNLTNLTADYTCPICQGGFVEIVENRIPPLFNPTSNTTGNNAPAGNNVAIIGPNEFEAFIRQVTPFFNMAAPQQLQQSNTPSTSQPGQVGQSGSQVQTGGPAGPSVPQVQTGGPFQGFLQTLLQGLSNNGNVQIQFHFGNAEGANAPLTLHGNMADYAWGPGGLDAIVTQLLNQVEGGAPPMQKDKIDQLPEVVITKEQADKRLQCAVCMEDFHSAEKVCQIACEHLFHKDCIVPWLQRHNSCPVCRKSAETGEATPRSPPAANNQAFTLFGGIGTGAQQQPAGGANQQQPAAQGQQPPRQAPGGSGATRQWMDIDELD